MTILFTERMSDSPYIETVTCGQTAMAGSTVRPAEIHWHMVVLRLDSVTKWMLVGPLETSGVVSYGEGAELLWIRFKLGTFLLRHPTRTFLNMETELPEASGSRFWLDSSAWQVPDYENVEAFVNRLVRDDILASDPIIHAALQDRLPEAEIAARTVRHRFLQATGLPQKHIRQVQRAQQAATLLEQGTPILDVVHDLGYFDQPHLTRSLKRFIGVTPAQQLVRSCERE
ncbi:MAG: helix-turn-helix domain-containing protein [bacterium]|nr:helix-turn-helix domain-containing protein [bacterium]